MAKRATEIFKCSQLNLGTCHGQGWHVQTYHVTGNPWSEERCPLYATKAEALEAARQRAGLASQAATTAGTTVYRRINAVRQG